jgi:hypothetical protein
LTYVSNCLERVFLTSLVWQTGQPWHDLVEAVRSFLQLRQDAGAEDMVSLILFNDKARCACKVIPLAGCLARLGNFLQMRGGGTAFGPALSLAHQVMAASLQQSEYLPLVMFMSDGGSSDGEPEMVRVQVSLHFPEVFRCISISFQYLACSS